MPSFACFFNLSVATLAAFLQMTAHVDSASASPVTMPWLRSTQAHTASPAYISAAPYERSRAGTHNKTSTQKTSSRSHRLSPAYRSGNFARSLGNDTLLAVDSRAVLDDRDILSGILGLQSYYDIAAGHSDNIHSYAAAAGTAEAADDGFQQGILSELTAYNGALSSFQSLLGQLGRDKGLANYDRQNDLETLLKNVVNLHKYTLDDVDCLIAQIPTVGPLLAPILYDIKCILDLVLDAVENLTDAILNALQPLLQGIIGSTVASTCSGGSVLGICL